MKTQIFDGRRIADEILQDLSLFIKGLATRPPHLAILRVGDNPASKLYVHRKIAVAKKIGIDTSVQIFPQDVSVDTVLDQVNFWNNDDCID
jgi:methylenetetrahydrofolate dehydrogenase (NADP+)/methenyltetrahydrofolate cyclohydrolase